MNGKKYTRVVVVGSVAIDSVMGMEREFSEFILPEKLSNLNVSFTVDSMKKYYGGTGANVAYGLGLLGQKPHLVGAFGVSEANQYLSHLESNGVDTQLCVVDEKLHTASGMVITDGKENQIWGFYPGALARMDEMELEVKKGDFVMLLPSTPRSFARFVRQLVKKEVDFGFDPAFFVPNLDQKVLRLGLEHASIIFGNEYEYQLMEEKIGNRLGAVVPQTSIMVKTKGKDGSEVRHGDICATVPVVKISGVADPTGAGDAYRAGFLDAYMRGESLEVCGRFGALVAGYCVETGGTQTYTFSGLEFQNRYREQFN